MCEQQISEVAEEIFGIKEILNVRLVDLRDQFAMAAMQGMFANQLYNDTKYQNIACIAYKMADAMLEQREKRG